LENQRHLPALKQQKTTIAPLRAFDRWTPLVSLSKTRETRPWVTAA
jgi:hypothetical protein